MSKNKEFVKFEKVDKSYDGKILVVKDLNLDISEGEFITMLGPSGSGKTTCLMMLAGFETPTNGEIFLDSNPISLVCKAISANGKPTVKISDDYGKSLGQVSDLKRYKRVFA